MRADCVDTELRGKKGTSPGYGKKEKMEENEKGFQHIRQLENVPSPPSKVKRHPGPRRCLSSCSGPLFSDSGREGAGQLRRARASVRIPPSRRLPEGTGGWASGQLESPGPAPAYCSLHLYFRFSVSCQSCYFSLPDYFPESTWGGSSEQPRPSRHARGQLFWKLIKQPDRLHLPECTSSWAGLGCSSESTGLKKVLVMVFGLRM